MSDEAISIIKTALSDERFAYDYSRSWRFLALTPSEHRKLLELLGLPAPQARLKAKVSRVDLGELLGDTGFGADDLAGESLVLETGEAEVDNEEAGTSDGEGAGPASEAGTDSTRSEGPGEREDPAVSGELPRAEGLATTPGGSDE